ncbi:MAG: ketoacid-CoA transferase [Deltaproteobacteria bacterium]|nr:ketoacid-CoA transferase [Deltaproteobacteria bacterium]
MTSYSSREMMTITAARKIKDEDIVFCGTGISMLAAMAAKHIHAPNSVIFFETGAIDAQLAEIPLAVGDSRVMYGTVVNGSLAEAFATMQNRRMGPKVVGILGAAQIDPFGNLNSTAIGDYFNPDVRFSGSGGASDVASFVNRTLIFMGHEKRKFVKKVDYLTSPGWLEGGDPRHLAGLPAGGPAAVITNLAVMGFEPKTHRMVLRGCYPGVSPEQVLENMSFSMAVSQAREIDPPSGRELRILREKCDPDRLILGPNPS